MELSHFLYCALANLLESLVFCFHFKNWGKKNLDLPICNSRSVKTEIIHGNVFGAWTEANNNCV